ncbi:DUF262 domain-containing protein [Arthrobacter crusticola]|uniref:DUF262 domain-containing protein n=1 Tax=Arthrobacter crusticola TaxID=2547960 RepID=A0A4R5TXH6_9MICC|nr:DUF262 domain-containing protein [Arthrobacter crusticola]TDK25850.1 DUF262 domain-containing protein [Arthrobacter crusticola]
MIVDASITSDHRNRAQDAALVGVGPRVAVWKVRDLLADERIRIPDYQRPYAWSARNAAELVDDISQFTRTGDYRIGTVILHARQTEEGEVLDIVDGQQRLTTLHILARALRDTKHDPESRKLAPLMLSPFGAEHTAQQVRENARHMQDTVRTWSAERVRNFADSLFSRCEVVVVTLANLDEAFQMFDSQNSRGRSLYPTDLLKAFHLREIGSGLHDAAAKRELIELWEEIPATHVNALFSEYLFKIRRWASGRNVPREGFTNDSIAMFKGIRERDAANLENRWARPFVYAKNFTDDYRSQNATLVQFGMLEPIEYPHQIDQPVLNGETFFRMVAHYYALSVRLGLLSFCDDNLPSDMHDSLGEARSAVLEGIDRQSGPGGNRSRYAYVRGLLDALLLYYTDRFGNQDRDAFAVLAGRFIMIPRAQLYAVRRESINDHALGTKKGPTSVNFFHEIRDARTSREVLRHPIPRPRPYGTDESRFNEADVAAMDALWTVRSESDA